jgi:hypothetical protein
MSLERKRPRLSESGRVTSIIAQASKKAVRVRKTDREQVFVSASKRIFERKDACVTNHHAIKIMRVPTG